MMYVRAFFIVGFVALAASGTVIVAFSWNIGSPRLLASGVLAAIVGIGVGTILLARALPFERKP